MLNKADEVYDRRKNRRYELVEPINMVGNLTNQQMGVLANLSNEGMLVEGILPLKRDVTYKIKLVLLDVVNGKQIVPVSIQCLWNKQQNDTHYSGCRVINMPEGDKALLKCVVDRFRKH